MTPKPTSKLSLIENRGCTNSTTLIVGPAVTGFGVASAFAGSYIIIGVSAGFMGSAYAVASVIGPCKISLSNSVFRLFQTVVRFLYGRCGLIKRLLYIIGN
jgi:hypothetical protein